MRRYAIADYLTDAQKRHAVEHDYAGLVYGCHRDASGYCPLGHVLAGVGLLTPYPSDVARFLGRGRPEYGPIVAAAAEFIADWDEGRIPSDLLTIALGLDSD